jgi:DNA-binding FrmR family transcriptional regulator
MKYGYADNKEQIRKRLRRIEGQVRGVERMVDADEYCIDILTQISAIDAAMDKVALELLRDHTKHCIAATEADSNERDAKVDEVVQAVNRLLKK